MDDGALVSEEAAFDDFFFDFQGEYVGVRIQKCSMRLSMFAENIWLARRGTLRSRAFQPTIPTPASVTTSSLEKVPSTLPPPSAARSTMMLPGRIPEII